MLKYQQFEGSISNATKLRALKCPCINKYNNKEGQNSNKYQNSGSRYVFLLSHLQKKSNRLTNLDKGRKGLNQLVYISKFPYQIIANFVLKFPTEESSKTKKKIIFTSCLQEKIESHLTSTTSTASGITNARDLIRKCLKSHLFSNHRQGLESQLCPNQRQDSGSYSAVITFNFFINASNIPNSTSSSTKVPITSYFL